MLIKPSLQKLIAQDVPIKIAFKVGKIIKVLDSEYTVFEESKKKLFEKHGEENIEKNLEVKPENMKVFTKELNELLSIEVDIDIEKIKLEDLGEEVKLSPIDASNLDILIEE